MDISLKRILAYVIDTIFIVLITTLINNITFINPKLNDYNKHYDEYIKIQEDYKNKEIDKDKYDIEIKEYNYILTKEGLISSIITISSLIIYFGILPYFLKGQTLGKKALHIKIVSNKDKQLNIGNYLLRMVILNNIIFRIVNVSGVYFLNKNSFYIYSSVISYIESLIETIIIFMVILRKDNRGLHDMISGTKVIEESKE